MCTCVYFYLLSHFASLIVYPVFLITKHTDGGRFMPSFTPWSICGPQKVKLKTFCSLLGILQERPQPGAPGPQCHLVLMWTEWLIDLVGLASTLERLLPDLYTHVQCSHWPERVWVPRVFEYSSMVTGSGPRGAQWICLLGSESPLFHSYLFGGVKSRPMHSNVLFEMLSARLH